MNPHSLIPFSQSRDLLCCHCRCVVSCGPVHEIPNKGTLCGRCRGLAKPIFRNYAYEVLASLYTFPCRNWNAHCSRNLNWNEALEHEDNCSYTGCCGFFCSHPGAFCSSDRKPPTDDEYTIQFPDHLIDYVKCNVCECYLTCDPVFLMEDGKSVCHRCVNSNGQPAKSIRNLTYEKLARLIMFPCIYRNRGCPMKLYFGRNLWEHETSCSYGIQKKHGFKKLKKEGKERGVIMTHSGHYFGTITENSVLMAPPQVDSNQRANKDVLKSLKKNQKYQYLRNDSEEMSSERSSPVNIDDFQPVQKQPSFSSVGFPEQHFGPQRNESFLSDRSQYSNNAYPPGNVNRNSSFNDPRNNLYLAGHYPVLGYNVGRNSSFNAPLGRTESMKNDRMMGELKTLFSRRDSVRNN